MTGRDVLIALALKHNGNWDDIMKDVRNKTPLDGELKDLAENWREKIKCKVVTFMDVEYPQGIRNSHKPPIVLFYYGDLSLIQDDAKCVSYVGSRECGEKDNSITYEISKELSSKGVSVVTGLSKGIATSASKGANENGKAVAVLGCGIDYYYPQENKELQKSIAKNGLVISEYPNKTEPRPENFPMRNRIIAASSKVMVVGKSKGHSGTMIAVSQALNMGKDVCCIPQEIGSFNNYLIKEGAAMVENADDILFELRNRG